MLRDKSRIDFKRGGTRRSCKSEVTRKRVPDAWADLFGEQGYTATTLRQIAKRAKIDAGSIYYYFASKDEILEEVMDIGIRAVFDAVWTSVEALSGSTSNREKIEATIDAHLNTLLKLNAYTSANNAILAQISKAAQNSNKRL